MDMAGNTRCSKDTPKRIEFWAPLLVLIVVAAVLRVAYARDQALWATNYFRSRLRPDTALKARHSLGTLPAASPARGEAHANSQRGAT